MKGINTIEEVEEKTEVLFDKKDLQPNLLDEDPNFEFISTRPGKGGKKFHYYETHVVISIANNIFGFDGWSSNMVSEWFSEPLLRDNKYSVTCLTRMRVTLRESGIYHEDTGSATKVDFDPAVARCDAAKHANSDALKRTLRLFGNKLGNKLYDKEFLGNIDVKKRQKLTMPNTVPVTNTATKTYSNKPVASPKPHVANPTKPVLKRSQFGSLNTEVTKRPKLNDAGNIEIEVSKTTIHSTITAPTIGTTITNNVKTQLPVINNTKMEEEDDDDDFAALSDAVFKKK